MKKLIVLFLFISSLSFAQPGLPHDEYGKINYSGVVKVDSVSADQLYSNAKLWFAQTFKSAKAVIQLEDPNSKTVVGRGSCPYFMKGLLGSSPQSGNFSYMIKIETKDGRYKYSITDFTLENAGYNTGRVEDFRGTGGQEDNCYAQVQDLGEGLSASLKMQMLVKSSNSKNDW